METYVSPPKRLPLLQRILLPLVERKLGKTLVANRILGWYPKAFWGSGLMEALVAHDDAEVPKRLLQLLRMHVSFQVSCPFCIDLNSQDYRGSGISDQEVLALRGLADIACVSSFSEREKAALAYARAISRTPASFDAETIGGMKRLFSERAIVIIASTCAQVNFWTRLIQSFGVPPAGFSSECSILDLDAYRTGPKDNGKMNVTPVTDGSGQRR